MGMAGINNGVYVKIKKGVPNWILIHCVCHSFQLAVFSSTKEHLSRNLSFFIRETYSWFAQFCRQETYKQIYD